MIETYRIGIRTRLAEGVRILCKEEIKLPEGNRLAGRKTACRKEIVMAKEKLEFWKEVSTSEC